MAAEKPLRLLLVRHGESFNNKLLGEPGMTPEKWQARRQVDPDLSELGRSQAQQLSSDVAHPELQAVGPIGMLAVSPVRRALQTLAPTARRLGLRPEVWTDCFEVGGLWHSKGSSGELGITRSELRRDFPSFDAPGDVTETGWYRLQAQETEAEARERVEGTAARLLRMARSKDRPPGALLLLTHHDQLNLLLRALLRGGDQAAFLHDNAAVSCVDLFPDGRVQVLFLNRAGRIASKL